MNLLKEAPDYQTTHTASGVWRRYLYSSGALYSEFTSHRSFGGWPLVHVARGRSPETGKIVTARGIIAIGQKALGVLAVGQAAAGVVALGQAAVGIVAVGQGAIGIIAVGQLAVGGLAGVGQFATGIAAWGQGVAAVFGKGQFGIGPATLHTARNLLR